jgi:hypothetical protein
MKPHSLKVKYFKKLILKDFQNISFLKDWFDILILRNKFVFIF